jgi:glycosyltransferase involved in cell wall biosynthesis
MRVLFTTPVLEHPAAGGPQLRIENSIKALSAVSDLHIASRVPRHRVGAAGETLYRSLSDGFWYVPAVAGNRYLRKLRRTLRSSQEAIDTESSARFIVDLTDEHRIDVVWFGYGNVSFPLIKRVKELRPTLRTVCDTDSVWSRFVFRELPFQPDPDKRVAIELEGRAKEAEERAWVDLCDITTAVSEVDADYYRGISRDSARIQIFSNGIDLDRYMQIPPAPTDLAHPCMYLAGTFWGADSPMHVASRWVIEHVLPIVKEQLPDIRFYIVGAGSDAGFANGDAAVVAKGRLPSVLPYLCHADVALVPLKFESGTRFKILEAAACRIPLVSTALGAEGLPVENGRHILLADDPGSFAEAIVRLIRDRAYAEQIADNCRALVRERYSLDALRCEAGRILSILDAYSR